MGDRLHPQGTSAAGDAVRPSLLAERRAALGWSQADLAHRAGIDLSKVRALEEGRVAPWGGWGWSEHALAVAQCLTSTCVDVVAAAGCPVAACEELWPAFPIRPKRGPRPMPLPTPEFICDAVERVRLLREVLPELSDARRLVITRYFGLDGEAPTTLSDLAIEHHVQYYLVLRTYRNALGQLRDALARRGI